MGDLVALPGGRQIRRGVRSGSDPFVLVGQPAEDRARNDPITHGPGGWIHWLVGRIENE